MEKILGKLNEAQFHEFGHLAELRRIYDHMMETFWEEVKRDFDIPDDAKFIVDEEGRLIVAENL